MTSETAWDYACSDRCLSLVECRHSEVDHRQLKDHDVFLEITEAIQMERYAFDQQKYPRLAILILKITSEVEAEYGCCYLVQKSKTWSKREPN